MNYLVAILASILLMGGSFYAGRATISSQEPSFGVVVEAKAKLLADNVEQRTRLKESPAWDTSIVSSLEMTKAYADTAEKYGVSAKDVQNAGGNMQAAIQKRMAERALLCDNPNSSI